MTKFLTFLIAFNGLIAFADEENFSEVEVKCPATNAGKFESVTKNRLGNSVVLTAEFARRSKVSVLRLYQAEKDRPLRLVRQYKMNDKKMSPADRFHAEGLIAKLDVTKREYCDGNAESKREYEAKLQKNRAELEENNPNFGHDSDGEGSAE